MRDDVERPYVMDYEVSSTTGDAGPDGREGGVRQARRCLNAARNVSETTSSAVSSPSRRAT
ncbi:MULTISPECIES: hypothetical protein [Nonomuraea]|uniref:Uncharacterized protein n=1 Tax=Nonomuraea ferruginea TaxID=46174 RepID=A0ABT4TCF7_9ACTN|nr:hypothetical protein [Nonomuraea ferruginea]MDA0647226.1 hypothetical protein [Nonomuraea ferruginea]